MKIKRYVDKDMRNVLRRVRDDQGPDAVILSNQRVAEGIEVIAAVDYDEALVRHAIGVDPREKTIVSRDSLAEIAEDDAVNEPAGTGAPTIVSANLEANPVEQPVSTELDDRQLRIPEDSTIREMRNELSSMRGLLETQLSGLVWKEASRKSPIRAQVLRNLARIGIAPDVANIIVNRLEPIGEIRSIWHQPLMTLAKTIPVKEDDFLQRGGTCALIGPTGVGKTTTIAKIAARYAMSHDPDEIALVCADAYRIGAKEHLMAFANIVGVKVHYASNSDDLADVLVRLKNKKLILIDTEGRSQRDRELAGRLAAYGSHSDRVRFYLTLSAASQEAGLDESIRTFDKVPLEGCIVTKTDEAGQLGCVLSALIRHDLPLTWLSDGQRIPDDLHAAIHKRLWIVNQAVECMEQSEPKIDERLMAENYAQVSVAHA